MDLDEERRCEGLGPFELKDRLVALAKGHGERLMLNAGRGNPNWVALEPRAAFVRLGEFALAESAQAAPAVGLGGLPARPGIAGRLRAFLSERAAGSAVGSAGAFPSERAAGPAGASPSVPPAADGDALLLRGLEHAHAALGIAPDELVGEWVDGILGDHYPLPVRMLPHAETLVRAHLVAELFGGDLEAGRFDLFAVEGASAGIAYVFQSLLHSGLLAPGDRIALGVPIFTPYLELPRLPEHRFEVVEVVQDEAAGWRYPPAEIDKLRDPRVRAFLAVNPSNPTAVAMDPQTVERIAAIARERPDLVLVTDDVYACFVEGFRSLAAAAPRNTIALYSFSKFWGATGLRLGVVGLHASNAMDARLAAASGEAFEAACARYGRLSVEPQRLKLIDRMVADSRAVGLNHTAGLSSPQQVQMSLMALDALLDTDGERKRRTRAVVRGRFERLYRGVGLPPPEGPLLTRYYATIDVPVIARERYGEAFARWLVASFEPIDFVVRLAEERGIVLLDGGGFDAPRMSVRVSLANLPDDAYEAVGRGISELLAGYHAQWRAR